MPFPTPVVGGPPLTRASNGHRGEDIAPIRNTVLLRNTRSDKFSADDSLHLLAVQHDDELVLYYYRNSEVTYCNRKGRAEELAALAARAKARAPAAASALALGPGRAKAAPALADPALAALVRG